MGVPISIVNVLGHATSAFIPNFGNPQLSPESAPAHEFKVDGCSHPRIFAFFDNLDLWCYHATLRADLRIWAGSIIIMSQGLPIPNISKWRRKTGGFGFFV